MRETGTSRLLAEYMEEGMKRLKLDPTGLQRATGLSATVLMHLRNGQIRSYQARTTRPVCDLFGWQPDGIERLMRGEPPLLAYNEALSVSDDSAPATSAEVAALAAELRAFREELRRVRLGEQPPAPVEP